MMTATTLRRLLAVSVVALAACQTDREGASGVLPGQAASLAPIAELVIAVPAIAPVVEILEPDLWREIRSGFALDHATDQRRVQQELKWLERNPAYLQRLKPRLNRYLAYIHEQVRARGFPSEIALLPIVESALDPYAFSHGGAAGLWQFIPATGKRFGLQRNWWYDGRRDPVAATTAALDYLAYLHKRFGDWPLALAGYNAGEGNVRRAQRRAIDGATFWQMKLPKETSAYVPRLLALAELVADPQSLGVTLPEVSPEVAFSIVDTHDQLDLGVAAKATGIDVKTLYLWNPALNQWATPPRGPHQLLLPNMHALNAQAQISAIADDERVQWLRVTVATGDTLSQLAQRHRSDVASLRKANNLRGNRIRAGQTLLIPKSAGALANPVAKRSTGKPYIVKPGDSLWTISRATNVSLVKLMKANHVGPKDYLRIGQTLTLPGAGNSVIRKVRYGVRKGDSLAKIAHKFNVDIGEIAAWNRLNTHDYLQPGQSLMLYVNVVGGE